MMRRVVLVRHLRELGQTRFVGSGSCARRSAEEVPADIVAGIARNDIAPQAAYLRRAVGIEQPRIQPTDAYVRHDPLLIAVGDTSVHPLEKGRIGPVEVAVKKRRA